MEYGEAENYNVETDYHHIEQMGDEGLMKFQDSPQNIRYDNPMEEYKTNSDTRNKYSKRMVASKTAISEVR